MSRDATNDRHAREPRIGDFWHDMFWPCFVVVDVGAWHVIVLETTKEVGPAHWTWNLEAEPTLMTRAAFNKRVRYYGIAPEKPPEYMDGKCWCDVVPERDKWVADELAALARKEGEG